MGGGAVTAAAVVSLFLVFTAGPATAKEFATLHVYGGSVQVHITGTSGYADARDGQALHAGDVVKTGNDGRAEIRYFDGSVSRLDFNTTFRLRELSTIQNRARSKVILADEQGGQSFNRITKLTDSQSRVEVATPTATASVQGTEFVVGYVNQQSQVLVVEGLVAVHVGHHVILVPSGHKVVVLHNGTVGPVVELTPNDLHSDFLNFNQCTVDETRRCSHKTRHHHRRAHHRNPPTYNDGGTTTFSPPSPPSPPGPPTPPVEDTTAPDTTITDGPNDAVSSTSATFAFESTELDSTFECSLDNGDYKPCNSPKTYNALSEGDHAFAVSATDDAGNTDATPASWLWTVDTTGPAAPTIGSGPANPTNQTTATFTFGSPSAARSPVAASPEHFRCSVDGDEFHHCSSPKTYTSLGEGDHSFEVQAVDSAGNAAGSSYDWTIDLTPPPAPVIDSGPAKKTNHKDAAFSFHGGGASAATAGPDTFECSLDGGGFSACSSPHSINGLLKGKHGFAVEAVDAAGNASDPAGYDWEVDLEGPVVTITSHPPALTNLTAASIGFTVDDPDATTACSLDGGASSACTSPVLYSGLGDGAHSAKVVATDAAGNTGDDSTGWTVDATPPDTSITAHPPDPTDSTSASFSFISTEPGSTFQCNLDAGGFSACSSPLNYSSLADGVHAFLVRATDPAGNTDPTPAGWTWHVQTEIPNHPPVATNDAYNTNEDTPLSVGAPGVLTNDTDADGDPITAVLDSGPSHAAPSGFTLNSNGSFGYTPAGNYSGTDSFTYHASDGAGSSGAATVTITVNAANDPPTAATQSVSVNEDAVNAPITLSGTDVDGDATTFSIVTGPSHGTLGSIGSVSCDSATPKTCTASVPYSPAANYNGSDSFSYKANDGHVDSSAATVTITVNAANDPPTAATQSVSVNEDAVNAPITLSGTDVDGDATTFAIVTGPSHGTLGSIGSVTCDSATPKTCTASVPYSPTANYNGSDSFTYKANDGHVDSSAATVTITVNAVNDAPTADAVGPTTANQGVSTPITLTGHDIDSSSLSFSIGTGPTKGTLGSIGTPSCSGTGPYTCTATVSYTSGANDEGSDSFTYQVSDGTLSSSAATVSINIFVSNHAPTANPDAGCIHDANGTGGQFTTIQVVANDTDPENDTLTLTGVGSASHGTAEQVGTSNNVKYTVGSGYIGTDSFTYTISDGHGHTATGTVTITIVAGSCGGL